MRERRDALTSVEKVVLGLLADDPAAGKPVARACTDLGISRRWLQTTAGRVVGVADPREHTASEYASAVREMLAVLDWPGELAMRPLGQVVRAPNADKWEAATRVEVPGALRSGSIHSFKGQEAEAVAVVIPQRLPADSGGRTAVDAWEDGTDTEARRVLYVGVSRAERLLVLAAHRAHANRVESVLRRDGVPYERRPT